MHKVINELRYYNGKFPRKALERAMQGKDEVTPLLLKALDEVLEDPAIATEDEDYMLHVYALYLLAQFREQRAFPKIIELILLSPGDVEFMLGDTITESLQNILYSTYNGDLSLLEGVIENPDVELYARGSTLDVLGQLCLDGEISKEYLLAYLRKLINERTYDEEWEKDFNGFIQDMVYEYRLFDMLEDIRSLYDEGQVDPANFGDFDEYLSLMQTEDHDGPRVRYIDDVIEEMHWWASFQDAEGMSEEQIIANQSVARLEKLRRNAPCPCGSGKKYKRCCMP